MSFRNACNRIGYLGYILPSTRHCRSLTIFIGKSRESHLDLATGWNWILRYYFLNLLTFSLLLLESAPSYLIRKKNVLWYFFQYIFFKIITKLFLDGSKFCNCINFVVFVGGISSYLHDGNSARGKYATGHLFTALYLFIILRLTFTTMATAHLES